MLLTLSLCACMLGACGQTPDNSAPAGEDGYTIDNIRNYVVGLDEKMVLENGTITENGELQTLIRRPDGYLNKLLYIE